MISTLKFSSSSFSLNLLIFGIWDRGGRGRPKLRSEVYLVWVDRQSPVLVELRRVCPVKVPRHVVPFPLYMDFSVYFLYVAVSVRTKMMVFLSNAKNL